MKPKPKKVGSGIGDDLDLQRDILIADLVKRILGLITEEREKAGWASSTLFDYNTRALESIKFLDFLGKRKEDQLVTAIAHLTANLPAVMNYVQAENELEYQFVRPSPRLGTTIKRYIRSKHAYRMLVPLHFHQWNNILQELFGKVITEITAAPRSSGMKVEELTDSLTSLMKDAEKKARAQLSAAEVPG